MSGSGEYVDVDEGKVHLDDMHDAITDTISYTRSYADTLRGDLTTSIENIRDTLQDYKFGEIDDPGKIVPIARPSFPTGLNLSPLRLQSFPSTNLPNLNLRDYNNKSFEMVVPVPPAEVDENFGFNQKTYSSEMWMATYARVHTAILNGQYAIPPDIFSAIVDMEQESRRASQDKEFQTGINVIGAMGWDIPSGHATSFVSEFQANVLKKDQDSLNNITAKNFEIANANMQFFINAGIDMDKSERNTFAAAETISLEAAKAAKEYLARFFSENVKLFLAKYEGEKIRLEGIKIEIDAIMALNDGEVKVYLGRAQVLEATINAVAAANKGMTDSRLGDVQAYAAQIAAVKDQYMALVEELRVNQETVRLKIDSQIKIEELKSSVFIEKQKLALAATTTIGGFGSQGIASALGAINTSLSNSYSGAEQRSESWSNAASISEVHDYAED